MKPQFLCWEAELTTEVAESNLGDLLAVGQASTFHPRLQLFGSNSEACKEGKIAIAHWGLVRDKDRIEDLGKEVELYVAAGRVKAIQFDGDTVITNYDRNSPQYIAIATTADEQSDSGCMYGPEFLVWLAQGGWATYFMASKTARKESGAMVARHKKSAVLSAKLIKTKKYSWHGPVINGLDTPTWAMPDEADRIKQVNAFLSPKASVVQKDESPEADVAR